MANVSDLCGGRASVGACTGTGVAFAGRQGEHTGLIYIAAMAAHNVPEGATISMVRVRSCPPCGQRLPVEL